MPSLFMVPCAGSAIERSGHMTATRCVAEDVHARAFKLCNPCILHIFELRPLGCILQMHNERVRDGDGD